MTTATTERTPAEERKAKADEGLKKLETERAQLPTRKQSTEAVIERLHKEIVEAERAGAGAKTLAALRQQRVESQQILEDLARMVPVIDRDLELARAELKAATVACHADRYNGLVEKQRALTEVLIEAVMTITETIKVKEGLAKQQEYIQGGDVGRPYTQLSAAGVRHAFLEELTIRLQNENVQRSPLTLQGIDWSCRHMRADGELE